MVTEKKKKVYLPSGGDIQVPESATEEDLKQTLVEVDPAVVNATYQENEDGSCSFVLTMGTKG